MLVTIRKCDYCGGTDDVRTFRIAIDDLTYGCGFYNSGCEVDLCDSCFEKYLLPFDNVMNRCLRNKEES